MTVQLNHQRPPASRGTPRLFSHVRGIPIVVFILLVGVVGKAVIVVMMPTSRALWHLPMALVVGLSVWMILLLTRELRRSQNLEAEITAAQNRTAIATRAAAAGIWDWDIKADVVLWDETMFRIFDMADQAVPGGVKAVRYATWRNSVHPDDVAHAESVLKEALETDSAGYHVEFRVPHRDGTDRYVFADGTVVRDALGRPIRVIGVNIDITERRAVEARAATVASALDEAQRIARLGSWSYHLGTGVVYWSMEVYCLFGRDPALGPPDFAWVLDNYEPESAAVLADAVHAAAKHGTPYNLLLRPRYPVEGVRYVRGRGRAELGPDGQPIRLLGTVADVTAEVERERELSAAREAAEQASRIKSEFLANMSHELRTPMTAILGFAEVISDPAVVRAEPDRVLDAVSTIRRNGEHLLGVLNDILDLSKIEAGRMDVIQVATTPAQILKEVVALLAARAADKGVALELVCDADPGLVIRTDPMRFRQIALNLIGNAVKFTEFGHVRVAISARPAAALPGHSAAQKYILAVEDTGAGIAPEHLPRLFRAFEQGDASMQRRFGGTGLGLRISKSFAELMGGDIRVQSEPGKGSRFELILPLIPDADLQAQARAHAQAQVQTSAPALIEPASHMLQGRRVLVVDDSPDNQRLIAFFVTRAGASVDVADNGLHAISMLQAGNQPGLCTGYDLILMDVQMPEMDGLAAARAIRNLGYSLPLIALTAHAMAGVREECLAAGYSDFAAKPVDTTQLIARCAALLAASPACHSTP